MLKNMVKKTKKIRQASGRFVLRLPSELHGWLKHRALVEDKSLNQFCWEQLAQLRRLERPDQRAQSGVDREQGARSCEDAAVVDALLTYLGDKVLAVYQYGSSVRGEATANSDVDILCVLKPEVPIRREIYRRWDERAVLDEKVVVHFVHPPKDPMQPGALWLEIALEGVPLYDPHLSVHQKLIQLRHLISEKRFARQIFHGHPVWIRPTEKKNA